MKSHDLVAPDILSMCDVVDDAVPAASIVLSHRMQIQVPKVNLTATKGICNVLPSP
jgi:hypothetical protein